MENVLANQKGVHKTKHVEMEDASTQLTYVQVVHPSKNVQMEDASNYVQGQMVDVDRKETDDNLKRIITY